MHHMSTADVRREYLRLKPDEEEVEYEELLIENADDLDQLIYLLQQNE